MCHGQLNATVPLLFKSFPPQLDFNNNLAVFDGHRIGLQISTDRRPLCLASSIVKLAVVHWTFDNVIHYQPVGEVRIFVGAQAIGAEKFILVAAVNSEGPISHIKADQIFGFDIVNRTCVNFFTHFTKFLIRLQLGFAKSFYRLNRAKLTG
jgi:hypothetical protein